MSDRNIRRAIGWVMLATACVIILYTRIIGLHLTEGELLIEYAHHWIVTAGLMFGGYIVMRSTFE